jgi:hypothetical protein
MAAVTIRAASAMGAIGPWTVRWPHWLAMHGQGALVAAGKGLVMLARHTGIPVTLLAAGALVASWRLARRTSRLAVEFALAVAVVATATKMGWIAW